MMRGFLLNVGHNLVLDSAGVQPVSEVLDSNSVWWLQETLYHTPQTFLLNSFHDFFSFGIIMLLAYLNKTSHFTN